MAQTSEELRSEIERTREEMGDTVDALAHKADVPTRTKEWIGEKKDAVMSKVGATPAKVGEFTPDGDEMKQRVGAMKRTAERNPLGLAVGGAAVGFLIGLVTPSTRVEDDRIGPMADEIKSTAAEAGREAVDRGKQVVQEAGQTALDTAKEQGKEQSEELSSSLQDKARELTGSEPPADSAHVTPRSEPGAA